MSAAKNVTTASFKADVLDKSTPVLVDFWAEWCGPCRQVSPILDQIAAEYAGKIEIVKVNVDEEQALAMQYGITSIPALQVFQGGQLVKSMVGAKPKPILVNCRLALQARGLHNTWREKCSNSSPKSMWFMCPTRASRRPFPTSCPDRSSSCFP